MPLPGWRPPRSPVNSQALVNLPTLRPLCSGAAAGRQKALYPISVPGVGANPPLLHQTARLGPNENSVCPPSPNYPPEKKQPANFTTFGRVVLGHWLFERTAKPGPAVTNTSRAVPPHSSTPQRCVQDGEGSDKLLPHPSQPRSRALLS